MARAAQIGELSNAVGESFFLQAIAKTDLASDPSPAIAVGSSIDLEGGVSCEITDCVLVQSIICTCTEARHKLGANLGPLYLHKNTLDNWPNTTSVVVPDDEVTVGFLYGAGAETLIFVTGTSGKYPKLFVSRQKNQSQLWIPRKPRKIGVWVSGAEIQTSAVDTRTAVWVSTAEKISKIVLGKTRNFSRKFRGVSAPALYKNPAKL